MVWNAQWDQKPVSYRSTEERKKDFSISKSELAREMNVSLSMISDYETGRRQSPGVNTIRKFVSAMIRIETKHGGTILRRYRSGVPYEALIDIRDYDRDINLKTIVNKIKGVYTR